MVRILTDQIRIDGRLRTLGAGQRQDFIEGLERDLQLRELYIFGIDQDSNVVILGRPPQAAAMYVAAAENGSLLESDTTPLFNITAAAHAYQRYEEKDEGALAHIERELSLHGVYVLGRDEEGNVIIIHSGRKTKDEFVESIGYGPPIIINGESVPTCL